jgi:hypothetical protein
MDPKDELTPALEAAKRRRATLHDTIVHLEESISSPAAGRIPGWTEQVRKEMTGVRDAWEQHVIVTEKPGGLYEEITERSPRLVGNIQRLQGEHPSIGEAVEAMVARLESTEITEDGEWPLDAARDDLQRFIGLVVKHRQRGADLVWEAYNVDIGGTE